MAFFELQSKLPFIGYLYPVVKSITQLSNFEYEYSIHLLHTVYPLLFATPILGVTLSFIALNSSDICVPLLKAVTIFLLPTSHHLFAIGSRPTIAFACLHASLIFGSPGWLSTTNAATNSLLNLFCYLYAWLLCLTT